MHGNNCNIVIQIDIHRKTINTTFSEQVQIPIKKIIG